MATATVDKGQAKGKVLELQHDRRQVREARRRDGGRRQPGHRRGDRQGTAIQCAEDVDNAVKAARKAYEDCQQHDPGRAQALLLKLADLIEERADEIADLESLDAGKPAEHHPGGRVPPMVDKLRFFAGAAAARGGPPAGSTRRATPRSSGASPSGFAASHPWNLPADDGHLEDRPGAATGNTLVLKPAETTR